MPYIPTPAEAKCFPEKFLNQVIGLADRFGVTIESIVSQSHITQSSKDRHAVTEFGVSGGWCQAIASGWLKCQLKAEKDPQRADQEWKAMSDPSEGHEPFKAVQHFQEHCHKLYSAKLDQKKLEFQRRQDAADEFKDKMNPPGFLSGLIPWNWITTPKWNENILKEFREYAEAESANYFADIVGWSDSKRVAIDTRIPTGKPPDKLLIDDMRSGGQFILLSKDSPGMISYFSTSIAHGLACKLSGSTLTFIDPNGCVWSGKPADVGAMYMAYAREIGFNDWFDGAVWKIVHYGTAQFDF